MYAGKIAHIKPHDFGTPQNASRGKQQYYFIRDDRSDSIHFMSFILCVCVRDQNESTADNRTTPLERATEISLDLYNTSIMMWCFIIYGFVCAGAHGRRCYDRIDFYDAKQKNVPFHVKIMGKVSKQPSARKKNNI